LAAAAARFGEVVVVAPASEWSGCGHRVTTHAPIRIEERATGHFAIHGTPGDCVRLALHELARDADWVLSGVNPGGNLGADILHSGTVAAAREAALHGHRALAISHYQRRGASIDWQYARLMVDAALEELLAEPLPPQRFWNVNLPHLERHAPLPAIVRCQIDTAPLPLAFRRDADTAVYNGDYHSRQRSAGMDIDACFGGRIAASLADLW
jgi:5'-nucleotidase